MKRITIVEACKHGDRFYAAGDTVTVDDELADYLVSVGWAEGGPSLDRDAEVTLDVASVRSTTSTTLEG